MYCNVSKNMKFDYILYTTQYLLVLSCFKRYDTSTPGGDTTHRDQDFGYEIIDESSPPMISGAPQHVQQIPAQFREDILEQAQTPEEDSIAEQYRGTPPMKSKKKKPDRRSHEVPDHVSELVVSCS